MTQIIEDSGQEMFDPIADIINLCRNAKDPAIRQILLGVENDMSDDVSYEKALKRFSKQLRVDVINCERMLSRVVNIAFLYIISKYRTLDFVATSNCEARIKHAVEHLYNTYNATDDVVKFVILNVALGLDASENFLNKFDTITENAEFYDSTNDYIDIFKHIQKLRQASFKDKNTIEGSGECLYKLFKNLEFICKLSIVTGDEYVESDSTVETCSFKASNSSKVYPTKYALIRHKRSEYSTQYLFLRSVDDRTFPNGNCVLRLNYTDLSGHDNDEVTKVIVTKHSDRKDDLLIITPSIGKFYSYITGDLLRKRHRMSFCNGLTSYKYYGELAAAVMDALEIMTVTDDKQYSVLDRYILPVIKNNFNICKEDCVCTGVGCKFSVKERKCNKDKMIEIKDNLLPECLMSMDTVSILTILFSVVGCKEILPQIFAQYHFDSPQSYDALFSEVNDQLDKRFSEFSAEKVESRRREAYKTSIDYLSLDIDETKREDTLVAQTLKPFKIRAYTDALIASLENLDRDLIVNANPSENVYTISGKIDLLNGLNNINTEDVRSALSDTLKTILAYYKGLAECKQQQLSYEIQAEQASSLNDATIKECYRNINDAFMLGVENKMNALGRNPNFYTLFQALIVDADELKSDISLMLGREMVGLNGLRRFIELDDVNKKCYLIDSIRRESGKFEVVYKCDLDNEAQCGADMKKFTARVVELLEFFKGDERYGARFACYPQVLIHTSSKVNVDNTTINAFTVYDNEQYTRKKEYNVITYFTYEISKRYYFIAPKKFEKTRWITYPILIRCSDFYKKVIKGGRK